jgi:hypothetical protein
MASPMSEIFSSFQDYLNTEQELREVSGCYWKVMLVEVMNKVHKRFKHILFVRFSYRKFGTS